MRVDPGWIYLIRSIDVEKAGGELYLFIYCRKSWSVGAQVPKTPEAACEKHAFNAPVKMKGVRAPASPEYMNSRLFYRSFEGIPRSWVTGNNSSKSDRVSWPVEIVRKRRNRIMDVVSHEVL